MERKTVQREAIKAVIESSSRPLSVHEILDQAKAIAPTINLATIYRNLKRLARDGEIAQVTYPPVGTAWEKAGKPHHHHFHCRKCGKLLELEGCALDQDLHVPEGFKVEGHELFLTGVCADCA